MKILYLVSDPGVTPRARGGGFQTHVRETIQQLEALGEEVALLDSGKVDLAANGVPRGGSAFAWKERLPRPIRFVGRDALYLLHNRRFRPRIEAFAAGRGTFDVVYERYHAFQWAGGEWAARHGVPWVLEFNASVDEL